MLATLYANTHTKLGGYKIYDFMQHDSERPPSLEEAISTWA